jgi:type I restriction enzyme S subunit
VGEINIAPHKCCIGRGIAAVQAKDIHEKFLYQSMLLYRKNLQKMAQGSTFEAINRKELAELLTLLPPFPEQEKIADILTTVDGAIEKTVQVIEKTKELKKGLMQKLFTLGIGHKRFKKTEIGEIPVEWRVCKLGELCIGQPEYGANTPAIDKTNNLPRYIRITDITDDGKLLDSTWQSIEIEPARPYILKEGDLVFARSGATVGKTHLYGEKNGDCAFAGYLIRFKPDQGQLLPQFLFHFTHSWHYYNWVKGMLRAGAQPNINAKEYSNMRVPKPSIKEQKQIIEILNAVDNEIEKELNHKKQLETLKKGLMQVLLTGKLRVAV